MSTPSFDDPKLLDACSERCAEFGDPPCRDVVPDCSPCGDCLMECGYGPSDLQELLDDNAVVRPLL